MVYDAILLDCRGLFSNGDGTKNGDLLHVTEDSGKGEPAPLKCVTCHSEIRRHNH